MTSENEKQKKSVREHIDAWLEKNIDDKALIETINELAANETEKTKKLIFAAAKEFIRDKNTLRSFGLTVLSYGIWGGANMYAAGQGGISPGAWAAMEIATSGLDGASDSLLVTQNEKEATLANRVLAYVLKVPDIVTCVIISIMNGAPPLITLAGVLVSIAATELGIKLLNFEAKSAKRSKLSVSASTLNGQNDETTKALL